MTHCDGRLQARLARPPGQTTKSCCITYLDHVPRGWRVRCLSNARAVTPARLDNSRIAPLAFRGPAWTTNRWNRVSFAPHQAADGLWNPCRGRASAAARARSAASEALRRATMISVVGAVSLGSSVRAQVSRLTLKTRPSALALRERRV